MILSTYATPGIIVGSLNYPLYSLLYKVKSAVFGVVNTSLYYPCATPCATHDIRRQKVKYLLEAL